MATINLITKFLPYVDELFSTESKKSELTNTDFDFDGAKTVKVYKISTAAMSDYDRDGSSGNASRYGVIQGLDATTEEFTLTKDPSRLPLTNWMRTKPPPSFRLVLLWPDRFVKW